MSDLIVTIPASSLRRLPPGYSPPLWRWIVLPASVLMQRYYGGAWFAGDVRLTGDELRFVPGRLGSSARGELVAWSLNLREIGQVERRPGLAADTIDIHHPDGVQTFKAIRSARFVEELEAAISAAGG